MEVTRDDLIGDIAGFPIEIVHLMLEEQWLQDGGRTDISILQHHLPGAFLWSATRQEKQLRIPNFWRRVIYERDFDLFYQYYPSSKCLNYLFWD